MPVNILVADDSATMRRIMELTFAGEDAAVTSVDSGDACVELARQTSPDVVFADCSMDGIDGYGISAAIKNSPGLENTAVIVMASQKRPYDEGKGQAAGVDDHILKPFDTQHVIDRVNQVLSRPRARASAAAAPAVRPAAPAAPAARPAGGNTMAFGKPPAPPAPPAPQAARQAVAAAPARPAPQPVAAPVASATANGGPLAARLEELGLTPDQVAGVLALSREVIEQVVWEVVPELAETLIKEEIRRLTAQ